MLVCRQRVTAIKLRVPLPLLGKEGAWGVLIKRLNKINFFNHPQLLLEKEGRKKCLT
jgi:hypothetical protein